MDADQTYQYRSFGVPGLGFKRGLDEDRVVAPYASLLALSIRPRAVIENVRALEATGMLGTSLLYVGRASDDDSSSSDALGLVGHLPRFLRGFFT